MKAVISVTGKDGVGIVAKVSTKCAEYGVNIIDISQSVLSEYFAMIMLADIDKLSVPFADFVDAMAVVGKDKNLDVGCIGEPFCAAVEKVEFVFSVKYCAVFAVCASAVASFTNVSVFRKGCAYCVYPRNIGLLNSEGIGHISLEH